MNNESVIGQIWHLDNYHLYWADFQAPLMQDNGSLLGKKLTLSILYNKKSS